MNFDVREELKKSNEYRSAFIAAHIRNGIAFQLRAMRDARGWDQKEVAKRLGNTKLQPVVSRYENPDYGRFSISTLLELAAAFDVALVVKFAPFREVVGWESKLSESSLNVPSFNDESELPPLPKIEQIGFPGYTSKVWPAASTFFVGNTAIAKATVTQPGTVGTFWTAILTSSTGEGEISCQQKLV
jgi:transcriptional regulator with XRE-family HTH domain